MSAIVIKTEAPKELATPSALGIALRQLRDTRGLSAADAARVVGVSVAYVSNVENGFDLPSADFVLQLAALYRAAAEPLLALRRSEIQDRNKLRLDAIDAELLEKWQQDERRPRLAEWQPRQLTLSLAAPKRAARRRRG